MQFPNLFSPLQLKNTVFRNRVFSTGHDTYLPEGGLPSPALIAYQVARAKGGAGLIVVQVVGVHESARYTEALLMGTDDACIPKFRELISGIQACGARALVQLFHPGRELFGRPEGVVQPAYAPSCAPSERFRTVPRTLSLDLIEEITNGYGATARRMAEAGADGVEIVASHGYLPAQFLNPRVNARSDRYGGTLENRLRFTREAVASVRSAVPGHFIVGLRFSGEEHDADGLTEDETLAMAHLIKDEVDYLNVIAGTSAASAGAVHIAPPMAVPHAYLAPYAGKLKQATGAVVFVAGRINQPQHAERILAEGQADMCGMTRAMICDPEMANKAQRGNSDDIRVCIACNQACIGHFQLGLPISCIQHPETGRELAYAHKPITLRRKKVLVAGGGPAGLKAAACAAERGHDVTLCESEKRLGGQANLAQLIPGRAEFGGIVQNLSREAERAGVRILKSTPVDRALVAREPPDALILATGSRLKMPAIEGADRASNIVHAADVLAGKARTGSRVVVYDWLADWIGAGVAEKLAAEGAHVRIAVNGLAPAAAIQNYVRDVHLANLHKAGVEILPMMRLFGIDGSTVYFLHTAAQVPVILEDIDTVVLACPNEPNDELGEELRPLVGELHLIGDCLAPRTAEEAVFEGLKVAMTL
jgi:2,4-dienoyl-CoA reductase-like NADH-dependent reductase (Old Yellow Enzyme family)